MVRFSYSTEALPTLLLAFASLLGAAGVSASQDSKPAPIGILLAAGDFMSCGGSSRLRASENVTGMVREIKAAKDAEIAVAVLLLGDLAYDDGGKNGFGCFHEEVTQK